MFKNHLEMIGRNETASKKAKFWQSYVRSLKGSEDIKAEERRPTRRSVYPELHSLSSWPHKSIYDEPSHAAERIYVPGYRYLPIHRETYGYSPRPIYAHNYPRTIDRYRPIYHVPTRRTTRFADPFDAHKAWQDHLDRLAAIDRLYPSRYGLYLKDRAYPITDLSPSTESYKPKSLKGLEYEPDNKPHWTNTGEPLDGLLEDPFLEHARNWAVLDRRIRGMSRSCSARSASRERSVRAVTQDRSVRAASHDCSMRSVSQDRFSRGVSPTPVKPRICQPRDCEVAYDVDGKPLDGLLEDPFLERARNWAVLDRRIRGMSRWCSARSVSREPSVRAVAQDRSARAVSASPTPVKLHTCWPRDCEVTYDVDGLPLYSASGLRRRPWADIFNPSASLPISAITRDPFWYDYPELRPVPRWNTSPFYVRDSYLSPVKRTFLWDKHPMRPLDLMVGDCLTIGELSNALPYLRTL